MKKLARKKAARYFFALRAGHIVAIETAKYTQCVSLSATRY